ncbi:hypothetical protein N8128_06135 [Paracoccaceae bacterium]|nr:hypothetical protein [Paracoccaceae bacterium]
MSANYTKFFRRTLSITATNSSQPTTLMFVIIVLTRRSATCQKRLLWSDQEPYLIIIWLITPIVLILLVFFLAGDKCQFIVDRKIFAPDCFYNEKCPVVNNIEGAVRQTKVNIGRTSLLKSALTKTHPRQMSV